MGKLGSSETWKCKHGTPSGVTCQKCQYESAAPPPCPNCRRLAGDALAELSGSGIATPEGGYLREPHMLALDIKTLARERDRARAEVERIRTVAGQQAGENAFARSELRKDNARLREALECVMRLNPDGDNYSEWARNYARQALAAQAPGDVPDAPANRDKRDADVTPAQVEALGRVAEAAIRVMPSIEGYESDHLEEHQFYAMKQALAALRATGWGNG